MLVNIGAAGVGWSWSHARYASCSPMAAGGRRCAAVGLVEEWYSCGDSGRGILLREAAELGVVPAKLAWSGPRYLCWDR